MTKSFSLLLLHILIFLIQYSFGCPRIVTREEWGGGNIPRGGEAFIPPAFYFVIHQSKYEFTFKCDKLTLSVNSVVPRASISTAAQFRCEIFSIFTCIRMAGGTLRIIFALAKMEMSMREEGGRGRHKPQTIEAIMNTL
jgi:hypothetical protein